MLGKILLPILNDDTLYIDNQYSSCRQKYLSTFLIIIHTGNQLPADIQVSIDHTFYLIDFDAIMFLF